MKRLPMVILFFAVLVAVVTGCSRAPRYDDRLTAADSLMRSAPDSALALVEGVCRDSLAAECDRAYRDLLLTQARYRCYVTATSDSDINRALAYYRAHQGEREKLTRAYIYKGAVMEELNHPDSAMLYYKHAEATAAPDDYFNLGYINLRISDLFLGESSEDSSSIYRLNQAIRYFESLQDTTLLIYALGNLGSMIGYSHPDSAKRYLWRAINLARKFDTTLQYSHESTLAGVYLFQQEYAQANTLAMDVLRHGSKYSFETQFYYYAAMSFIKLGKLDSAKYVMSITPAPEDEVDSLAFLNLTAEISKVKGKPDHYVENVSRSKNLLGEILYSSRAKEFLKIDSDFDHHRLESDNISVNKHIRLAFLATGVLLLLMLFLIYWIWHKNRAFCKEKVAMTKELELAMNQLENLRNNSSDTSITGLVSLRLSAIQEVYQSIRIKTDDAGKTKKVMPLSGFLKSLNERNVLTGVNLKDTFWHKMRESVDGELNGIVTFVEERYPELSERDLQFFTLICAKLSPQLIRLCMDIKNAKSVTNIRGYLMKKMGLDMSFDEFVSRYMNGELK